MVPGTQFLQDLVTGTRAYTGHCWKKIKKDIIIYNKYFFKWVISCLFADPEMKYEMEFKEFEPRFKSAKTRFKSWNIWYNFKLNQPYLNRGLNLNRRLNSLNSANGSTVKTVKKMDSYPWSSLVRKKCRLPTVWSLKKTSPQLKLFRQRRGTQIIIYLSTHEHWNQMIALTYRLRMHEEQLLLFRWFSLNPGHQLHHVSSLAADCETKQG